MLGVSNLLIYEHLKKIQEVDIQKVEIESLVDLRDVKIKEELPKEERIEDFIKQIKNPYCFRYGNTIVKISNLDALENLEEKLKSYYDFFYS